MRQEKWVSLEIISLCVSLFSSYSTLPFSPQMEHGLAPSQELLGHSSLTECESVKPIGMFTKLKHVLVFSYFLNGNAVKIFKTLKNVWLLIHIWKFPVHTHTHTHTYLYLICILSDSHWSFANGEDQIWTQIGILTINLRFTLLQPCVTC